VHAAVDVLVGLGGGGPGTYNGLPTKGEGRGATCHFFLGKSLNLILPPPAPPHYGLPPTGGGGFWAQNQSVTPPGVGRPPLRNCMADIFGLCSK